jgi:anti-sigma factor RsiW
MTCSLSSLRLTEHADGLLSSDDCAAVERHLRECPTCGDLRADLEALARLCRAAGGESVKMPDGVRGRIEAMLAAADPVPPPASQPRQPEA